MQILAGRSGGAVSLAVGMSQIFSNLPGFRALISYWYHFTLMFEALFILTTMDTGTRLARFLVQEFLGRVSPKLARTDWLPGTLLSTTLVRLSWGYLLALVFIFFASLHRWLKPRDARTSEQTAQA